MGRVEGEGRPMEDDLLGVSGIHLWLVNEQTIAAKS